MAGNPDPRPASSKKRPPTEDERVARARFKHAVLVASRGECLVHHGDGCEGELQAHHVVTQQQIRSVGRHDLLWDWHNGMALCELAHSRHTLAIERVPFESLPGHCIAFAALHGFEEILRRYYTDAT